MSGKRILETSRLIVREFVEDDAEAFFAFNSRPEVNRYTGEPPSVSVDEDRRRIRDYPDYRLHGYGRWAVVYRPEGRVIGFNGLKYLDDLGETDLGYRFHPDYWGRGIATESSLAIVRFGFDELGLDRIIGLVDPANVGSIRVLRKVGMRFEGVIRYFGVDAEKWAVHRREARPAGFRG